MMTAFPTEQPAEFALTARPIPPKPTTLRAHAEAVVREMVLRGQLVPGQRINEVELSAQLEISRGILREALRSLEREGLVVSSPHRGVVVRLLTAEEAMEITEVRLALETTAARRIARGPLKPAIDILKARFADLELLKTESYATRTLADLAFHEAVCECCGNAELLKSWRALMGAYVAMLLSVRPKLPVLLEPACHRPLLDAVISRDQAVIETAWREHFSQGLAQIVAQIQSHASSSD